MAKPHLTLHFHAHESIGPLLESTCRSSKLPELRDGAIGSARSTAAPRTVSALLKLANTIGAPVQLSFSNERLLRALSEPSERKALSDGVSRGRFLAVPTSGLGADLRLLAPFETADELRVNTDLWTRAMITPPFAVIDGNPLRVELDPKDPASTVARFPRANKGRDLLFTLDLGELEAHGSVATQLAALSKAIRERSDIQLARASALPIGGIDRLLGDLLQGGRYPSPHGDAPTFDPINDGFPLELARGITGGNMAARAIAPAGANLVDAYFDISDLDEKVAIGLLLRALARTRRAGSSPYETLHASFLMGTGLVERVLGSEEPITGEASERLLTLAALIPTGLETAIAQATSDGVDNERIAEAKKAKTRAVRALPKPETAPVPMESFLRDLLKACAAAVASTSLLAGLTPPQLTNTAATASVDG